MNRLQYTAAVFAALLLGAAAAAPAQDRLAARAVAPVTAERLQRIGLRAPSTPARPAEFQLPRLDGGTLTLSALKGKVVLLSFWATWCSPCRIEMPSMQRTFDLLKNEGFEVLAVDMMDDAGKARAFARDLKLTFPILADVDESVGARYAVSALPTTYLLDRQGRVVARAVGGREWDTPETLAVLRDLLSSPD